MQKVLGLGSRKYSSMICERLQGNYIPLSLIKHGSYTVEKCLKACGCGGLDCFSKEIAEDKSLLAKLARHEFGNFVVKVALEVSKMVSTEFVCLSAFFICFAFLLTKNTVFVFSPPVGAIWKVLLVLCEDSGTMFSAA